MGSWRLGNPRALQAVFNIPGRPVGLKAHHPAPRQSAGYVAPYDENSCEVFVSTGRTRPSGGWRIAFTIVAVAATILFVRLGFWQLDRLGQKRAASAVRNSRQAETPLSAAQLIERLGPARGAAAADLAWRRVRLSGRWDFRHEVLIRGHSYESTPGVFVVTPLVLDSGGAELPVLRGWLPSPDAMTPVAISTEDEGLRAADGRIGVLLRSSDGAGPPVISAGEGETRRPTLAAIDVDAIEAAADDSLELLPMFAHLLPEAEPSEDLRRGEPVAIPLPDPGNGPHLSYAIQWFSFALITLVGTWAFLYRRPPSAGNGGPGVSRDPTPG